MKKRTGKILALLLSLTMMAGVMAGCGSEKTDGYCRQYKYTGCNQVQIPHW